MGKRPNVSFSGVQRRTELLCSARCSSCESFDANSPSANSDCFNSFYQGGEVAISGWVISYLIQQREGDPSKVGNVTSGFWGGITGRLSFPGPKIPSTNKRQWVALS
jgi:hypothetical protein